MAAPSVSRSTRTCCSSRLVQPGPSIRRATSPSRTAAGPPTAAMRRSGPCDLEYERTWTTRSGSRAPRLTSRADAISPEWSSSTTSASCRRRTAASSRARVDVMLDAGRVVRARLQDDDAGAALERPVELVGPHALAVERDRHALEAQLVQQVEQRREAGVLDGHPRAVARDALEDAADRVEGAVDDRDPLGGERPRLAQQLLERGDDGRGEVGAGVGGGALQRDPGERRADQRAGARGPGCRSRGRAGPGAPPARSR